jgi:hypothetical protein
MVQINAPIYTFNQGEIGKKALGRLDLERYRVASELMDNWLPSVLGPKSTRTGLKYLGLNTKDNNFAVTVPFIFNTSTKALLELTDSVMRVISDNEYVFRETVSTSITNGDFSGGSTGWTFTTSVALNHVAYGFVYSNTQAELYSTIHNWVQLEQAISVSGPDQGVEHGIRIKVTRGSCVFRVGSSSGDDDIRSATTLLAGDHHLTFTPDVGTVYISFKVSNRQYCAISDIEIQSNVVVEVDTIWPESALRYIEYAQSADVIFVACSPPDSTGYPAQRIERRSQKEWSVVNYETKIGPYNAISVDPTEVIDVAPATGGHVLPYPDNRYTVSATFNAFRDLSQGDIFELNFPLTLTKGAFTGLNQETSSFKVTGKLSSGDRDFGSYISNSGVSGFEIQVDRAIGAPFDYSQVLTITSNENTSRSDNLDGVETYRRGRVSGGTFGAGDNIGYTFSKISLNADVQMQIIYKIDDSEVVAMSLGDYDPSITSALTNKIKIGAWSGKYYYPSAVALHDGRLFWAGQDRIWGSESDAYTLFDLNPDSGDSKSIDRRIDVGSIEGISSLLSLQRLIAFTPGFEASIRSSSFDEPLTNEKFLSRKTSNRGSAHIKPIEIDGKAIFVNKDMERIYELVFELDKNDYGSNDLTRLHPLVCKAGVVAMAAQRSPETRIYFVLADGTVRVLTYEKDEKVIAWSRISLFGDVEDVAVLPGIGNDEVYFTVKRTVNGSTTRSIERLAPETSNLGEASNQFTLDSYIEIDLGTPGTSVTGLSQYEGETIAVWGDGANLGEYTVSGGAITLSTAATNLVVGYPYECKWKSVKLAYANQKGTALLQKKRVNQLGLLIADTAYEGLLIGPDFNSANLQPIRKVYKQEELPDAVYVDLDDVTQPIKSNWDTDSRVCQYVKSPDSATVLAMVIGLDINEK